MIAAPIAAPIAAIAYVLGSMAYVFKRRGHVRYTSLREYVRKSWPIFAPFNCLLYLCTPRRARRAFPDLKEYPELQPLQANWQVVREEAQRLVERGYFEQTSDPEKAAYFDVGFRTFQKYGWSKFYLNWYGHTHASARELCPETVKLLSGIPSVNGALFSLLFPGSQLTRHLDPLAVSLRYHLGLSTPNSDDCSINVDGEPYSWRDGEAAVFDVTYLHHARNDTDRPRLILMCDVERPLNPIGKAFNFLYKGLPRLSVVPNLEGDKQGLLNRIFSTVSPALARTKALKRKNRKLYKTLKFLLNGALVLLLGLILWGIYAGLAWLMGSAFG